MVLLAEEAVENRGRGVGGDDESSDIGDERDETGEGRRGVVVVGGGVVGHGEEHAGAWTLRCGVYGLGIGFGGDGGGGGGGRCGVVYGVARPLAGEKDVDEGGEGLCAGFVLAVVEEETLAAGVGVVPFEDVEGRLGSWWGLLLGCWLWWSEGWLWGSVVEV